MISKREFLAGVCLGVIAFIPTTADALYKRVGPQECRAISTTYGALKQRTKGLQLLASGTDGTFPHAICPFPADNDLPLGAVSTVNVHVVDASYGNFGNFLAKACITRSSTTGGGACGTAAGTSTTPYLQDTFINPSPSAWNGNPSAFPYVDIQFPGTNESGSLLLSVEAE